MTDKWSKERFRWPVSSTRGSRNFADFEQLMGEFVDDSTKYSVKAAHQHSKHTSFRQPSRQAREEKRKYVAAATPGHPNQISVSCVCRDAEARKCIPDRFIMATSGNRSFESTKIDCGQTPSTTIHGCLAGRRLLCGRQKKNFNRFARHN